MVCQRGGGNTENNNGVKLHKDQIWISVGESVTSLPAGRTTWCAFSPQTGVDITERTQKNRRGRLADTHNSFALQSHPFCNALDIHLFPAYIPLRIRLLLLLWLEVCLLKAWLSAGSLFFHRWLPSLHLANRLQSLLDRPQSTLFCISS